MDVLVCLFIVSILFFIKGIARSDSEEIAEPVTLTKITTKKLDKKVETTVKEIRNLEEEINVLGEDIMKIINE